MQLTKRTGTRRPSVVVHPTWKLSLVKYDFAEISSIGHLSANSSQLLQYLRTKPSPLCQTPITYTPSCIKTLIERLQPFELSKGEVVMILNLRPSSVAALNTVLEDMGDRYTETEQEDLVSIISEVLGQFDEPEGQEAAEGDTSMQDNTEAS